LAGVSDLLKGVAPGLADLAQRLFDLIGSFEGDALGDGRASHISLLSGASRTILAAALPRSARRL
jgi:hypothetical protein